MINPAMCRVFSDPKKALFSQYPNNAYINSVPLAF